MSPSDLRVRLATPADAARLCEIYNREVEQSTTTVDLVPRSLDDQRRYIADRSGGLVVAVAEVDATVVGFGSLSFYRDRPGYRTSVEDSVYVHHEWHGRGVGRALLEELLRLATSHGFHTVFARVIDAGAASLSLHESLGFELVGIERQVARKFGRWHDVALLQRLL